jgi:hypothetical protein
MTTHPLPREPFAAPRIAAISGAGPRRPIAMVLGMHRSGTSLCAHILGAMGIDIADEIGASASNVSGHWERWEIVEFHDRILRLFNRDYLGPLHDFPLPAAWWADPRVSQIKREIVAFLAGRMGDGYFGFKDPRTVRLLPLWHQIFNDLKLAPKMVLCVRNPAQVARSLGERDNLDPALGEYRWLVYMVDFFRYCGGFEVCTVDYEDWFRDPCANFEKLKKLLDVEWQQSRPDLDLVLSGIVDPALRHDESHYNEPYQPLVRSLYRLVGDYGRDSGVRDEVNNFVAQFISFQNSQAPLHQALENLAATATKYPELEQEAVALRADIEQRAATEAALRADIEQRAATEVALRADIEQRAATEAALRADIEQRAATEAALRADIEQRAATEAALRADIEQRAAIEAALRADIEQRAATEAALHVEIERGAEILRSTVAERDARERAAAEVLQGEIASLRSQLAVSGRDLRERTTAVDALRGEIRSSRIQLAAAEREARERGTAAEVLQGEITSLRSELDAARDVGRAALASLRTPPAPIPEVPRNTGWVMVILRRLGLRSSYPIAASPVIADG